jgi:hypothetical protein
LVTSRYLAVPHRVRAHPQTRWATPTSVRATANVSGTLTHSSTAGERMADEQRALFHDELRVGLPAACHQRGELACGALPRLPGQRAALEAQRAARRVTGQLDATVDLRGHAPAGSLGHHLTSGRRYRTAAHAANAQSDVPDARADTIASSAR